MPIYDRPVWKLMQDEAAPALVEPFTRADVTHWFGDHYPKVKPNTVGAHVIALTANHPSQHHYRLPAGASPLFFRRPDGLLEHFDPDKHLDASDPAEVEASEVDEVSKQVAQFALEAQLESFLATNWGVIDWGRPLAVWKGPDGESGHQLTLPVGRLDFLCTDSQSNALVVVELKRGRPSDKVVGQIARYIGYVKTKMAEPDQPVEGLIVAHESDDELHYAVAAMPGLQLATYDVKFKLKPAPIPSGG